MRNLGKSPDSSRWGFVPKKGAAMSKITLEIAPRNCGDYSPGHEVHFIPAIRFAGEQRVSVALDIVGKAIIIGGNGNERIYFNHQIDRIQEAISSCGVDKVSMNVKRLMLYVQSSDSSSFVFNLSKLPIGNCSR